MAALYSRRQATLLIVIDKCFYLIITDNYDVSEWNGTMQHLWCRGLGVIICREDAKPEAGDYALCIDCAFIVCRDILTVSELY
jgi:hypothetical protein